MEYTFSFSFKPQPLRRSNLCYYHLKVFLWLAPLSNHMDRRVAVDHDDDAVAVADRNVHGRVLVAVAVAAAVPNILYNLFFVLMI